MPLGTIAAGLSIINGVSGLMGGSSPDMGGYNVYQPQYMPGMDQLYNQAVTQAMQMNAGLPGMVPSLQQILAQQQGLPYQQYQQAANQAAMLYPQLAQQQMGLGQQMLGQGQNLYGLASGLQGAGQQAYMTALDPMRNIYDQQMSDLTNLARANESAAGLASTPYGASVVSDAQRNLLMAQQQDALSRQLQGLNALQGSYAGSAGLMGQGAGQIGAGMNYLMASPQTMLQGGYTPLQAGQQIGGMQMGDIASYLSNLQGMTNPLYQEAAAAGNYMTGGQRAAQAGYQDFSNAQQFAAQQKQGAMQGLGAGLASLGGNTGSWGSGINAGLSGLGSSFSNLFSRGGPTPQSMMPPVTPVSEPVMNY